MSIGITTKLGGDRGKEGTRQLYVLYTGPLSDRPARTLG